MSESCIYEGKISEIHTSLSHLIKDFNDFKGNDFHELKEKLECVTNKLNKPRLPMWTTWILTLSSALITGLTVFVISMKAKGG